MKEPHYYFSFKLGVGEHSKNLWVTLANFHRIHLRFEPITCQRSNVGGIHLDSRKLTYKQNAAFRIAQKRVLKPSFDLTAYTSNLSSTPMAAENDPKLAPTDGKKRKRRYLPHNVNPFILFILIFDLFF